MMNFYFGQYASFCKSDIAAIAEVMISKQKDPHIVLLDEIGTFSDNFVPRVAF